MGVGEAVNKLDQEEGTLCQLLNLVMCSIIVDSENCNCLFYSDRQKLLHLQSDSFVYKVSDIHLHSV